MEDDERLLEEDYYSFLNVSRNATNEELNNAYRRLSRLYHPDKHVDPLQKKEAEHLFNKTKKAYEVLIDPHRRAIYDNLGTRGLETEGWEIVQRTKTPQEIREEYERLAREKEERALQQNTNPKGNVTININATDLFSSYSSTYEDYDDEDEPRFPSIEVSGMSFSQSIEAPLTIRDIACMSGQLSTQNGTGTGSVNVSLRKLLSEKGWVEFDVGFGNGPVLSLKGYRTLTRRIFYNGALIMQFTPHGIRPGLYSTLAMQLDKNLVGYLSWRIGLQSGMTTTVIHDTPTSHTAFNLQFGIPHSFISLAYTHKMDENRLKLRGFVKIGTFGAAIEYGAEKKVSQYSSLSASVSIGVPAGVSLKLKLSRANQTYIMPIHLCVEVIPAPVFYATVTPIVAYLVVKRLIIDPITKEQERREKERKRDVTRKRMIEKRQEALAAVQLMRETYNRIRSDEDAKHGLVIVNALYGSLVSVTTQGSQPDSQNVEENSEVIDVLIPLQCLVKDSKLVLHEASKSQLPGFYDPCYEEDKYLLVEYLFHDQMHGITISDNEQLKIPKQSHRINPT